MNRVEYPPGIEDDFPELEIESDDPHEFPEPTDFTFSLLKEKLGSIYTPTDITQVGILDITPFRQFSTIKNAIKDEPGVSHAVREEFQNLDLTDAINKAKLITDRKLSVKPERLIKYEGLTTEDGKKDRVRVQVGRLTTNLFFASELDAHFRKLNNPLPYALDVLGKLRESQMDRYHVGTRQGFEYLKSQTYLVFGRLTVVNFINNTLQPAPNLKLPK